MAAINATAAAEKVVKVASGAYTVAQINAAFGENNHPNAIESLDGGSLTVVLLDDSSLVLTGLPTFWFRPIQIKSVTSATGAYLLYRSAR